jgi:hypothetical protein
MVRFYVITLFVILGLLAGCSDPSKSPIKKAPTENISTKPEGSAQLKDRPNVDSQSEQPKEVVTDNSNLDSSNSDNLNSDNLKSDNSEPNNSEQSNTAEDSSTDSSTDSDQEPKLGDGAPVDETKDQNSDPAGPVFKESDDGAPVLPTEDESSSNDIDEKAVATTAKLSNSNSNSNSENDSSEEEAAPVLAGASDDGAPPVPDVTDEGDGKPVQKGAVDATAEQEDDSESGSGTAIKQAFSQIKKDQEEGRQPSVTAHWRSYYFYKDGNNIDVKESMTTGGWVNWQSGFFADRFQLTATAFTSQKLYAPPDKSGAGLLQDEQKGFSGLSEIYADIKIAKMNLRLGRFEFTTPYMNRFDTRMVPQSFEAGMLHFKYAGWDVGVGQISKIKTRNSIDFEDLYEVAGLTKNRNVTALGATHEFGDNTIAGFYYYYAPDYMYTFYTELNHQVTVKEHEFDISAQYTNQRAIGEKLGGNFQVNHFGIRGSWKRKNHNTYLAYTRYSDDNAIQSPWGSVPGYTNMMIRDFTRIGEKAVLLGTAFKMTQLNLPNVTLRWNLLYGRTPNTGIHASPDQYELDMTADYRFKSEILKGLWLRARYARVHETNSVDWLDGKDLTEIRVVLNYEYKW